MKPVEIKLIEDVGESEHSTDLNHLAPLQVSEGLGEA
jgi:hypothetical protein